MDRGKTGEGDEMKERAKFVYPRRECFYCGKMIAENWTVRHLCNGRKKANEIINGMQLNYFDEARKLLPLSNCLKRHYACVIVSEGNIIAKGWNESPEACTTCARLDIEHNTGSYEDCPAIHAEAMAMIKARENSLEGAELYLVCADEVDPIPCPTCQKLLDWAGVKQMREVQG